jgi:hypothetical protein
VSWMVDRTGRFAFLSATSLWGLSHESVGSGVRNLEAIRSTHKPKA